MGARISSGNNSKQNYKTPEEFMAQVRHRFGPISFDLAAQPQTAKAEKFFTEADDSLAQPWACTCKELMWLNPPYRRITNWAKKCCAETAAGANILFLVPASVGANWFAKYAFGLCDVYLLNGRLCFIPGKPYPKDLMLCHYHPKSSNSVYVWNWRKDVLYRSYSIDNF